MHRKGGTHWILGIPCSVLCGSIRNEEKGTAGARACGGCEVNAPWAQRDDSGAQGLAPATCGLLSFGSSPPLSLQVASPLGRSPGASARKCSAL